MAQYRPKAVANRLARRLQRSDPKDRDSVKTKPTCSKTKNEVRLNQLLKQHCP
jgi:hypothetical protein